MLNPEELLTRLDDQLQVLTAGSRTAAPRQQTLRAAIEWSYALLSEAEQAMLRRLGVFAGSFTLEAVRVVAKGAPTEESNVFDVLAGLVDKSLVVAIGGGETRYRLLESTRAFALEKLAGSHQAELARRLCEHMTTVFEQAYRSWPATPKADWLPLYEPELDNLRAAIGWSFGPVGDPALGVTLVSYTDWLWGELSLWQEHRRWFEQAVTFVDDTTPPAVEARIQLGLGWDLYGADKRRHSHNLRAIELTRQLGGEPVLLGQALTEAGQTASRDGNAAKRYHDEALSVLRQCGRTKLLAIALLHAGGSRCHAGDLEAGRSLVEEALALSKALGDVNIHDHCETFRAIIAFRAGQMAEAIGCARRAIEASRQHGTLTAEFMALHWLAALLLLDNQIEPGRTATLRCLELSRALGDEGLLLLMCQAALVLAAQGETDTAARLAGFTDAHSDRRQFARGELGTAIRTRLVEHLRCAMSLDECQSAMAAGAAWSEQEALAIAQAV